jgi:hypothetical protein
VASTRWPLAVAFVVSLFFLIGLYAVQLTLGAAIAILPVALALTSFALSPFYYDGFAARVHIFFQIVSLGLAPTVLAFYVIFNQWDGAVAAGLWALTALVSVISPLRAEATSTSGCLRLNRDPTHPANLKSNPPGCCSGGARRFSNVLALPVALPMFLLICSLVALLSFLAACTTFHAVVLVRDDAR